MQAVICDGMPLACIRREIGQKSTPLKWGRRCPNCLRDCADQADSFNLPYITTGQLLSEERRLELRSLANSLPANELYTHRHLNIEVGKLALSSVIRFFKGLPIEGQENIAREYLYAGLVNTEAAITAIRQFKPDTVIMSHGCYVDYGPAFSVATLSLIHI